MKILMQEVQISGQNFPKNNKRGGVFSVDLFLRQPLGYNQVV